MRDKDNMLKGFKKLKSGVCYVPHKTSAAMSHCWPKGVEEKLPTPRESLVNLKK